MTFDQIFNCASCGFWYDRDYLCPEECCCPCFWNVPLNRKRVIPEVVIASMMARELEALFAN